MKRSLPTLFALLITMVTHSQVISRFTWENGPVTQAAAGPDAISASSSALISPNGASGNGLNPGSPKKDIDLVLPGSPWFDVPGIDISIAFRREETQASFFKRGNQFDFGIEGGKLGVKFQVSDGSGGNTQVNAANIFSVPNDHAFHTYRFIYNSNTGVALVSVDENVVYTYNGTAGRALYWNGGNVTIGTVADATGNNVSIFDNLVVQNVPVSGPLPVKLISFTAQPQNGDVVIGWTTTREVDAKHFVLERSADGISYSPLATVVTKGNYTATTSYSFTDVAPLSPVAYYRLKMVDIDETFTYSDIRTASFGSHTGSATISCFPNPAKDHFNIRFSNATATRYRYSLVSLNGKVFETKIVELARGRQQIKVNMQQHMPAGVYVLELENISTQVKQAFKIVKS